MIEVYGFERADGTAYDRTMQDAQAAKAFAMDNGARVIAHTYVHSDSEPVDGWDFTEVDAPTQLG